MQAPWASETYGIAMPDGVHFADGFVYRGLGVHQTYPGSKNGRRKPRWIVPHLGSGHRLCSLIGDAERLTPIVTDLAEAGDWSFEGLDGWRNMFPEARECLLEFASRHRQFVRLRGGQNSENVARLVAEHRG